MKWQYGITTVVERRDGTFMRTIESLKNSGFDAPHIFLDGPDRKRYDDLGLPVTSRHRQLGNFANWVLAMWELYLSDPFADRYALFEDDVILCRGVREYLDQCVYPEKGYWNLYAAPLNYDSGIEEAGWLPSSQHGKGALGLAFNRAAVIALLSAPIMSKHPQDESRGKRWIDGAIVNAFKAIGWKEYIHRPGLVQHIGCDSIIYKDDSRNHFNESVLFKGESFDAVKLVKEPRCE